MEILDLLKGLVEINTTNELKNENELANYLYDYLLPYADKIEFVGSCERKNILAYFGNLQSKNVILFNGHLDVVSADKAKWKYDPFKLTIVDNFAFGRGVADMKGGIAIGIDAIIKAKQSNLLKDKLIIFAGSVDEESGACSEYGAKVVANYLKDSGIIVNCAIIAEPQEINKPFRINLGHRGLLWIKAETFGTQAHSGLINAEDNAVVKMVDFIKDLNKKITNQPCKVDGIPQSSARVTYINSNKPNIYSKIPNKCVANIDIRISPFDNIEDIKTLLKSIIDKYGGKIKIIKQAPSSYIDKNEKFVQVFESTAQMLNEKIELGYSSPTCDAHYFVNVGIPTINGLGASGANVHSNDEYIDIESLSRCSNLFYNFIKNYK